MPQPQLGVLGIHQAGVRAVAEQLVGQDGREVLEGHGDGQAVLVVERPARERLAQVARDGLEVRGEVARGLDVVLVVLRRVHPLLGGERGHLLLEDGVDDLLLVVVDRLDEESLSLGEEHREPLHEPGEDGVIVRPVLLVRRVVELHPADLDVDAGGHGPGLGAERLGLRGNRSGHRHGTPRSGDGGALRAASAVSIYSLYYRMFDCQRWRRVDAVRIRKTTKLRSFIRRKSRHIIARM